MSYWDTTPTYDPEMAKAKYLKDKEKAEQRQKGTSALSTAKKVGDAVNAGSKTTGIFKPGVSLGNAAGVAGGLYGAYNMYKNWDSLDTTEGKLAYDDDKAAFSMGASGAAVGAGAVAAGAMAGASMGSAVPVLGTAIGAVLGAAYGFFADDLKTGKHKHQLRRDLGRENLQKVNFLDKEGRLTLPDGSVFEMGKDGGFRYSDNFRAYEVDHKDPLQGIVFGHALPIAEVAFKGDKKLISDFAGYFTRAAISNTKDLNVALDNLKSFSSKLNINPDTISKLTADQLSKGEIDQATAAAYVGGLSNIFSDNRNLNFSELFNDEKGDFSGDKKPQTLATNKARAENPKKEMRRQVRKVNPAPKPIVQAPVRPQIDSKSWGESYFAKEQQSLMGALLS